MDKKKLIKVAAVVVVLVVPFSLAAVGGYYAYKKHKVGKKKNEKGH